MILSVKNEHDQEQLAVLQRHYAKAHTLSSKLQLLSESQPQSVIGSGRVFLQILRGRHGSYSVQSVIRRIVPPAVDRHAQSEASIGEARRRDRLAHHRAVVRFTLCQYSCLGQPSLPPRLGAGLLYRLMTMMKDSLIGQSVFFYEVYYRAQLASPLPAGMSAAVHYLHHGWLQGLDPEPLFSTSRYLWRNKGLHHASLNPLLHYLKKGLTEGRRAWSSPEVMRWQQPWFHQPELTLAETEKVKGAWPTLQQGDSVTLYCHSQGHFFPTVSGPARSGIQRHRRDCHRCR